MNTSLHVRTIEAVLRTMADGLKSRGNRKEYLNEAETLLLKQAWADLAIGIVDASGTMDEDHRAQSKKDRYQYAMKLLR